MVVVPAFSLSLARTGVDVAAIGRQAALPALSGAVIVTVGSLTTTAFSSDLARLVVGVPIAVAAGAIVLLPHRQELWD